MVKRFTRECTYEGMNTRYGARPLRNAINVHLLDVVDHSILTVCKNRVSYDIQKMNTVPPLVRTQLLHTHIIVVRTLAGSDISPPEAHWAVQVYGAGSFVQSGAPPMAAAAYGNNPVPPPPGLPPPPPPQQGAGMAWGAGAWSGAAAGGWGQGVPGSQWDSRRATEQR
jgi:hypothetical protein